MIILTFICSIDSPLLKLNCELILFLFRVTCAVMVLQRGAAVYLGMFTEQVISCFSPYHRAEKIISFYTSVSDYILNYVLIVQVLMVMKKRLDTPMTWLHLSIGVKILFSTFR